MSKKEELLDFYRAVLRSASMEVDDDGTVSAVQGNDTEPKLIDGQRLVIPTKNQLSNPNWEDRIVFHPIEENILRGESVIIETLRRDMNTKVNLSVVTLLYELMTLAASKAEHSKLNPDQLEFLTIVPEASEKDLEFLRTLFKKMSFDKPLAVSFYIKRGGKVDGKGYRRVGVASFPLLQELNNGEPKVFGVKPPSVKVRENVTKLLNYILPNQNTPEVYSRGSDDDTAPYFDALLKLFLSVADRINDTVLTFANVLDSSDSMLLEADWYEQAEDLSQYRRLIPAMKGNQGASEDDAAEQQPAPAAAAPAAAPTAGNWMQQPVAPAAPVSHNGRVSFADLQRSSPAMHQSYVPQNNNTVITTPGNNGGVMPGAATASGNGNGGWLNTGTQFQGSYRI